MAPRWAVLASAYVGAVVGAGFASGQEILQFFVRHGRIGLAGCMVAGLLFAVTGTAALRRIVLKRHAHYGALLRDVCGPWIGGALDRLGALALFIGLAAVVAAAGALGAVLWSWPLWWGSVGLVVTLALSALGGTTSLARLNLVAAPLIALACLACAWPTRTLHPTGGLVVSTTPGWTWLLSAALYVAYNMLLAVAGLCASCSGGERPSDAAAGGLAGGLALGALCAAVTITLLRAETVHGLDLPLAAVMSGSRWGRLAYPAVLGLSLWTTGSAAAAALGRRTNRPQWPMISAFITLGALPLALFGLRAIVAHLYPILGYCGLPLLIALLFVAARPSGPLGKPHRAR